MPYFSSTSGGKSNLLIVMVSVILWILTLVSARAQSALEIPSSFNPVGSGARALGMGGAFIAVADDATAASWNPGGLIQLETPEFSVVGSFVHRIEDNTFGTNPEASGDQSVSFAELNYVSISYPFTVLNRNMVISLNYQNLFDFTREWEFPTFASARGTTLEAINFFEQEGSLNAIGLAYCIEIVPQLSFGFTLNLWPEALNEWSKDSRAMGKGTIGLFPFIFPIRFQANRQEEFTFGGFNANVGILFQVTDRLTLGAVFKSPFTADLEHDTTITSKVKIGSDPPQTFRNSFTEDEKLDMPMSYGVGLAYRFSDQLTVSLDVHRTEWGDFVLISDEGRKLSPISLLPMEESDVSATHQVRMGAEYLFIRRNFVIPVRAGVFYDPAPAEGSPDDYVGFSIGSGIGYGRFIFDVAYQYRFGDNVGASILQDMDFSQDVHEHALYSSMIIHF